MPGPPVEWLGRYALGMETASVPEVATQPLKDECDVDGQAAPQDRRPVAMDRVDRSHEANGQLPDIDDPLLFPRLTAEQMKEVAAFATCHTVEAGEMLFDQGERNAPLYVLQEGSIDVLDRRIDGDVLISLTPAGTFIGDTSMFTGEPTIAAAVASERSKVMSVDSDALRKLVSEHSEIGDLILRTLMARREWLTDHDFGGLLLIGPAKHKETYQILDFLTRNQIPVRWRDSEDDPEAAIVLERTGVTAGDLPVLVCSSGVHRHPKLEEVARHVGLRPKLKERYDLIVIGGGPAGLAATVYGASEGLDTLMIDANSPGGQAGTSSKIENYLGFATGISGDELAKQAVLQARKFDATLCNPCTVTQLKCDGEHKLLILSDDTQVLARSIVLATGATYRRLEAERCADFDGAGVYYAAGHVEAAGCMDRPVAVVGAGNSAGQAAVYLSNHSAHVRLIVRGQDIRRTMSEYLVSRIEKARNIEVLTETQVTHLEGDKSLENLTLTGKHAGQVQCGGLFVMIGADPCTDWLAKGDCVGLCPKGFIATGNFARAHEMFERHWHDEKREPFFLETTRPGIFAVGDVRAGSVKRVASAVGEGSMAVKFVHEAIAATQGS